MNKAELVEWCVQQFASRDLLVKFGLQSSTARQSGAFGHNAAAGARRGHRDGPRHPRRLERSATAEAEELMREAERAKAQAIEEKRIASNAQNFDDVNALYVSPPVC